MQLSASFLSSYHILFKAIFSYTLVYFALTTKWNAHSAHPHQYHKILFHAMIIGIYCRLLSSYNKLDWTIATPEYLQIVMGSTIFLLFFFLPCSLGMIDSVSM